MKRILLNIILTIAILIMLNPVVAYAADDGKVGIEVSYSAEHQEYGADEEIITTLKIKNPNEYAIENFTARIDVPIGYIVKNNEEIPKNITLSANSKDTFKIVLVKEDMTTVSNSTTTNWWIWIVVLVALIIIAVLGVLFYKKKKRMTAATLVFCIMTGVGAPINVQAADMARYKTEIIVDVTIAGEEQSIKANLSFDYNEESCGIRIRTADFGYSSENEAYTISGEIPSISGWLDNAKEYTDIILQVYDFSGNLIMEKKVAASEEWVFDKVGLFPGKNYIEVQAYGKKNVSVGLYLIDIFGSNYFELDNSEVDTDGDGLYDLIEISMETDIDQVDTDNDGLTDYQEACELSSDPLSVDTEGVGIGDYDKDNDEDGISNGEEYILGTSPIREDTDFDGLLDKEEIEEYLTSAIKVDTDEDGAGDYWEVNNGYDPLVFNSSFDVTISSSELSEATPVSVKVQASINSSEADLESISVDKVYPYDNPYISASVAGYLGDAYEIMIDGDIQGATLTFNYDTSLGNIGEEFQPRIYYFNEEDKRFEELENQTVEPGVVSADTSHFSIYALLNKTVVDAAWSLSTSTKEEIKAHLGTELLFVMDKSASMCTEEKSGLGTNVIEYWVDNMREGYDKASIMTFTKATELLSEFTYDKKMLMELISGVSYDNGVNKNSGTDGTKALYDAIKIIADSAGGNKYVIYISDGDDNSNSYSYNEIKNKAITQEVEIYVINIGGKNGGDLETLATDTGGAYIQIDTDTILSDELDTVINEIMAKTKDTNNDGISDYYSELIKEGKILLSNGSNEFVNCDLNYDGLGGISDDCDGDGLKNGEEIVIVQKGKYIYCKMYSNPFQQHSDGDGISDYEEVQIGSDPLVYSLERANVDQLLDNGNFFFEHFYDNYDSSLFQKGITFVTGGLFGVWNKDEIYRDLIIEYYCKYATLETMKNDEVTETKRLWIKTLDTWQSNVTSNKDNEIKENIKKLIKNGGEAYDFNRNIHTLKSMINGVKDSDEINRAFIDKVTEMILEFNKVSEEATQMRFECNGLEYTQKLLNDTNVKSKVTTVTGFVEKGSKIMSGVSVGIEVIDTILSIAKINASSNVLENNLDVFDYITKYSEDDHAKDAVRLLKNQLAGKYIDTLAAVLAKVNELKYNIALGLIAEACPYVAAVIAVRDIFEVLFGISEDIKQQYEMLCYHEIAAATVALFERTIAKKGTKFYDIQNGQFGSMTRYLVHLAQLRVLGEIKFCEWQDCEGWLGFIGDWIIDLDSMKRKINNQLFVIKKLSDDLGLVLSSKLKLSV